MDHSKLFSRLFGKAKVVKVTTAFASCFGLSESHSTHRHIGYESFGYTEHSSLV